MSKSSKPFEVQITGRDIEIFRALQKDGSKTAQQIADLFWKDKSKIANAGLRRISKLVEGGYLEKGNPKLLSVTEKVKGYIQEFSVETEITSVGVQ